MGEWFSFGLAVVEVTGLAKWAMSDQPIGTDNFREWFVSLVASGSVGTNSGRKACAEELRRWTDERCPAVSAERVDRQDHEVKRYVAVGSG